MKKNILLLFLFSALLCIFPLLLHSSKTFPSLDSDFGSTLPEYQYVIDYINKNHSIPLVNPYIAKGIATIGDPTFAILNPIFMLPLAFFGLNIGTRLSLFLVFFTSALAMYFFLSSLKLNTRIRIWGALLFEVSGGLTARVAAGHIEKFLVYPFLPLFFMFSIQRQLTITRIIFLSLIFTGVVFSGDLYTLWFLVILFFFIRGYFFVMEKHRKKNIIFESISVIILFFIFASPQLVPFLFSVYTHMKRYASIDPYLGSVHFFLFPLFYMMPFQSAFYDRPSIQKLLGLHYNWYEYYAFISPLPFLFLFRIKHVIFKTEVRIFLFVIVIGAFYVALRFPYSIFYWLFHFISIFRSFRVPQRMDMIVTPVVIALLALCADNWVDMRIAQKKQIIFLHSIFFISFVWCLLITQKTLIDSFPLSKDPDVPIIHALRICDTSPFYIVSLGDTLPHDSLFFINEHIFVLNYYYGWVTNDTPSFIQHDGKFYNDRILLTIRPKYILADKRMDFTKYHYVPIIRNNRVVIWKTQHVTITPKTGIIPVIPI